MNFYKLFRISSAVYFLIFTCSAIGIFFLSSCANVGFPTGGKKDITPPQILKCTPENFSTSFQQNEIEITFDELVTLHNASTQIFISPALTKPLTVLLKGKTLHIHWDDTLKNNTTYTLNLGSSITDMHEGNKLPSYQYVFSTGSYIDSLSVSGNVMQATNGLPAKQVEVLLYKNLSDSSFTKSKPDYYSVTDDQGKFTIDHLSSGDYKLYAMKDESTNLIFDQPTELIAFNDDVLHLQNDVSAIKLTLFKSETKNQRVLNSWSSEKGKIQIAFSNPTSDLKITSNDLLSFQLNDIKDTCVIWFRNLNDDSAKILITDVGFSDSAVVAFKRSFIKKDVQPTLTVYSKSVIQKKEASFILSFNHPIIQNFDEQKIFVEDDSTHLKTNLTDSIKWIESNGTRNLILKFMYENFHTYSLTIDSACFFDVYGLTNAKTKFQLSVSKMKGTGNLSLTVFSPDSIHHFFMVLSDKNQTVISKQSLTVDSTVFRFEELETGTYYVKIIEDLNENMKWDNGNFYLHRQPEQTFFYSSPIQIRDNWDIDIEVKPTN